MSTHWRILSDADYRRTPWRNGGGVSTDLAIGFQDGDEAAAATADHAFLWRLSRTLIATPGPFSIYPGVDRLLLPLAGRGLWLEADGGEVLDASEPFMPVRFPGELRLTSRLAVPVEVLNLMWRRDRLRGEALRLQPNQSIDAAGAAMLIHAPAHAAEVSVAGASSHLSPGDTLFGAALQSTTIRCVAGEVVVALFAAPVSASTIGGPEQQHGGAG